MEQTIILLLRCRASVRHRNTAQYFLCIVAFSSHNDMNTHYLFSRISLQLFCLSIKYYAGKCEFTRYCPSTQNIFPGVHFDFSHLMYNRSKKAAGEKAKALRGVPVRHASKGFLQCEYSSFLTRVPSSLQLLPLSVCMILFKTSNRREYPQEAPLSACVSSSG